MSIAIDGASYTRGAAFNNTAYTGGIAKDGIAYRFVSTPAASPWEGVPLEKNNGLISFVEDYYPIFEMTIDLNPSSAAQMETYRHEGEIVDIYNVTRGYYMDFEYTDPEFGGPVGDSIRTQPLEHISGNTWRWRPNYIMMRSIANDGDEIRIAFRLPDFSGFESPMFTMVAKHVSYPPEIVWESAPELVRLTPAMTSNTTPAPFAVSAKSRWSVGTEAEWHLFDQKNSRWAAAASDNSDPNGYCDTWVAIYLGSQRRLGKVELSSRDSYFPSHPRDFVIEGSNDGSTWTTIKTSADVAQPTSQYQVFYTSTFPLSPSFSNFRIRITRINGGSTNPTFGELYLYGI